MSDLWKFLVRLTLILFRIKVTSMNAAMPGFDSAVEPTLPSKLDYLLRRLLWLQAPKVSTTRVKKPSSPERKLESYRVQRKMFARNNFTKAMRSTVIVYLCF